MPEIHAHTWLRSSGKALPQSRVTLGSDAYSGLRARAWEMSTSAGARPLVDGHDLSAWRLAAGCLAEVTFSAAKASNAKKALDAISRHMRTDPGGYLTTGSHASLAHSAGLCPTTFTTYLSWMCEQGLLIRVEQGSICGGRGIAPTYAPVRTAAYLTAAPDAEARPCRQIPQDIGAWAAKATALLAQVTTAATARAVIVQLTATTLTTLTHACGRVVLELSEVLVAHGLLAMSPTSDGISCQLLFPPPPPPVPADCPTCSDVSLSREEDQKIRSAGHSMHLPDSIIAHTLATARRLKGICKSRPDSAIPDLPPSPLDPHDYGIVLDTLRRAQLVTTCGKKFWYPHDEISLQNSLSPHVALMKHLPAAHHVPPTVGVKMIDMLTLKDSRPNFRAIATLLTHHTSGGRYAISSTRSWAAALMYRARAWSTRISEKFPPEALAAALTST